MRYNKERQKEHLARVKRILVINSNISVARIMEELKKSKNPLILDKDYALKLVNKIRKERTKRFERYTVDKVLVGFQDEVEELKKNLWNIINGRETEPNEKTSAIRELRNSSKDLFDKFFDSGIFERDLGKLKMKKEISDEDKKLLNQAIKYAGDISKEDNREQAIQEGTGG